MNNVVLNIQSLRTKKKNANRKSKINNKWSALKQQVETFLN